MSSSASASSKPPSETSSFSRSLSLANVQVQSRPQPFSQLRYPQMWPSTPRFLWLSALPGPGRPRPPSRAQEGGPEQAGGLLPRRVAASGLLRAKGILKRAAAPAGCTRRALAETEHQRAPTGPLDCHRCRDPGHGDAAVRGPVRHDLLRRACWSEVGHSRLEERLMACHGGLGAGRGCGPQSEKPAPLREHCVGRRAMGPQSEKPGEPMACCSHCRRYWNQRRDQRCARERRRSPRRWRCCWRRTLRLRRGSRRSAPPKARRRTSHSTA